MSKLRPETQTDADRDELNSRLDRDKLALNESSRDYDSDNVLTNQMIKISDEHLKKISLVNNNNNNNNNDNNKLTRRTDTHEIGVVVPPEGIRAIVLKTAQFVAKNGQEFERRILSSEQKNQKFSFLRADDPYHAYYRGKIEKFKSELIGASADEQEVRQTETENEVIANAQFAVKRANNNNASNVRPEMIEKPREFKHSDVAITKPPFAMKQIEIDVIKLSAQFVARNGAKFLSGLAAREYQNQEFAFLKPAHPLFTYFTALADSYSEILMPENKKELERQIECDCNPKKALERSLKRSEWEATQASNKKSAEEKRRLEREAMEAIDWHDFKVVETIDFDDGEDESLPEPIPMREIMGYLRRQALEDASKVGQPLSAAAAEEEEEDKDEEARRRQTKRPTKAALDEEEKEIVQQAIEAERLATLSRPLAPSALVEQQQQQQQHASGIGQNLPEPGMKIVRNYKKPEERAVQKAGDKATKFAVSPITGELVPVDEMAEHMRISLIDPKWKEQKDAMLKKLQGSNKVDDDTFARNILSLAKSRPDIFASGNDREVSAVLNEQMKKQQQQQQQMPPKPPPVVAPLLPQQATTTILPPPPMMMMPPPTMTMMPPTKPPPPPQQPVHVTMETTTTQKRERENENEGEEQPAKQKLRIGDIELEDEEDWLKANDVLQTGEKIQLKILCPNANEHNLLGQEILLEFDSLSESVLSIKQKLKPLLLNLAQGKMKLEIKKMGFLKDQNSLAFYNVPKTGQAIHLSLKKR